MQMIEIVTFVFFYNFPFSQSSLSLCIYSPHFKNILIIIATENTSSWSPFKFCFNVPTAFPDFRKTFSCPIYIMCSLESLLQNFKLVGETSTFVSTEDRTDNPWISPIFISSKKINKMKQVKIQILFSFDFDSSQENDWY